MPKKYKKPEKHQQFTISAESTGHLNGKPKKKPKINQFTAAEKKEFEASRKETESTWSKIDRVTIDKQCAPSEVWDDYEDSLN